MKLTILSDLANNVAGAGYYEVYQNSISQLEEYRDKLLSEISSKKTAKDDDLDMFGDDENEDSKIEQINADAFESVQWEYKWGDQGEDSEIFGPFDTKSNKILFPYLFLSLLAPMRAIRLFLFFNESIN